MLVKDILNKKVSKNKMVYAKSILIRYNTNVTILKEYEENRIYISSSKTNQIPPSKTNTINRPTEKIATKDNTEIAEIKREVDTVKFVEKLITDNYILHEILRKKFIEKEHWHKIITDLGISEATFFRKKQKLYNIVYNVQKAIKKGQIVP